MVKSKTLKISKEVHKALAMVKAKTDARDFDGAIRHLLVAAGRGYWLESDDEPLAEHVSPVPRKAKKGKR